MDLFAEFESFEQGKRAAIPLADRMRPRSLDDFAGQSDMLGVGRFLRQMIENDTVPSTILYGPPGTGKTTLALIIARTTGAYFEKLNAVSAGISDIRKVVEAAKERLLKFSRATILFIDEIHRFNKTQQDVLLPYVENGTVILIGATTENPYFEVNSALLSRMRVIRLNPLSPDDIINILKKAAADVENGLGSLGLVFDESSFNLIADIAGGDARIALNILEQVAVVAQGSGKQVTPATLKAVIGDRIQDYDKNGDNHYDVVSAFIKSMRGSDADAALHYLARMIVAGEDPKFIARRIVICAAEDVGLADPQALVIATAAAQAVQFIGMPEGRIPLAQAAVYIATAPKSNAVYNGIDEAINDLKTTDCGQVPPHLRDAHYSGAKHLGHGRDYLYPHSFPGGYVKQQYLPDKLKDKTYYCPADNGMEILMRQRIESLKKHSTSLNGPK